MFPKQIHSHCLKTQSGFLLPLAIFLLVGIAFLAIALNRLSGQTGTMTTIEGLSVQAFYAAESGAQIGMRRLFFNAADRTQTDANCLSMTVATSVNYTAPGLSLCSAVYRCTQTTDSSGTTSFYYINSVGQCGSGQLLGEREIEVSAFMR